MNFVERGRLIERLWNEYSEAQKVLRVELEKTHQEFGSAYTKENTIRVLFDEAMRMLAREHWKNSLVDIEKKASADE